MTETVYEVSVRMIHYKGRPYLESRHRPIGGDPEGLIPRGKILIVKTPVVAPEAGEEDTERELIDDDGSDEAMCPLCAAESHDPLEMLQTPRPYPFRGGTRIGRNDPCPCGSGRKYKRCCIH